MFPVMSLAMGGGQKAVFASAVVVPSAQAMPPIITIPPASKKAATILLVIMMFPPGVVISEMNFNPFPILCMTVSVAEKRLHAEEGFFCGWILPTDWDVAGSAVDAVSHVNTLTDRGTCGVEILSAVLGAALLARFCGMLSRLSFSHAA